MSSGEESSGHPDVPPVVEVAQQPGDDSLGVVVATGVNRPGVAAALSAAISESGGDIRDISQTLAGEFYSMIFVVDTANISSRGLSFMDFKRKVEEAATRVGAHCVVLNAKVLKAMHRV